MCSLTPLRAKAIPPSMLLEQASSASKAALRRALSGLWMKPRSWVSVYSFPFMGAWAKEVR